MVDGGRTTDDGRTPDHGHPISSPCEPNGSGELKIKVSVQHFILHVLIDEWLRCCNLILI